MDLLIADVNCIGVGEALCKKHGVTSFPTIRTFQPDTFMSYAGLEYKGGRGIESLRLHATKLVPSSSAQTRKAVETAAAAEKAEEAKVRSAANSKATAAKVVAAIAGMWVVYRLTTER